eukprot:jgi/Bigna1/134849/aug1.27_g9557
MHNSVDPFAGMMTDFEVLDFLKANKVRDYPRLKEYTDSYNKLQYRIYARKKNEEAAGKGEKKERLKEKLSEMKREGEVVWIQDKVREFLQELPAGAQTSGSIKKLFEEAHHWDEEFEVGPGLLSAQGIIMDKLVVNGIAGGSLAHELGMHSFGKIVKVNDQKIGTVLELKTEIDKVKEGKYKITVRGSLSPAELINIVNARPDTPPQLHSFIDSCDDRMSEATQDFLIEKITTALPVNEESEQ